MSNILVLNLIEAADYAANWAANNPTPAPGQLCVECDTGKFKIGLGPSGGAGTTAYNSLSYAGGGGVWGSITGTLSSQTDLQNALNLKANIASPTFTGTVTIPALNISGQTASTIASFDASKNLISLSTSTYPSLTELSYVKGLTSSAQTQISSKQAALNGTGFVKQSGSTTSYDNSTYLTTSSAASTYLPLIGGTVTGLTVFEGGLETLYNSFDDGVGNVNIVGYLQNMNSGVLVLQPVGPNLVFGCPASSVPNMSWTNTLADSQSNGDIANFITNASQGNMYINNGLGGSATAGMLFGFGRGTPSINDIYFQAVGGGDCYIQDNLGGLTNTLYCGYLNSNMGVVASGNITTTTKVGIGTASPTYPLDVQTAVTASSGVAYGTRIQQTLNAAANNDKLFGVYINPTYNANSKTGLVEFALAVNGDVAYGVMTNQYSGIKFGNSILDFFTNVNNYYRRECTNGTQYTSYASGMQLGFSSVALGTTAMGAPDTYFTRVSAGIMAANATMAAVSFAPVTNTSIVFRNYSGTGIASIDTSGNLNTNGAHLINQTPSTVNGSTSGSAQFSQPFQGSNNKTVRIYCNALVGTASYTFPTAFTYAPTVLSTNGLATTLVTSLSTTGCTVTGATSTGQLIIDGY